MFLNCKTYYSYCYGTFSTEQLVAAGSEVGATSLALTNINNTADAWDFVRYCKDAKITPIVGAEIRNGETFCYILLAKNNQGFADINRFLSEHLSTKKVFPAQPPPFQDVYVIYAFGKQDGTNLGPQEFVGIRPSEVGQLFNSKLPEKKCIILHPVTFQDKLHYNLHRLLRAIDLNVLGSKLPSVGIAPNDEMFQSPHELLSAFMQYPGIILNTMQLISNCCIEMDFGVDKNKKTFSATKEDDRILLDKLARDGMAYRYGKNNPEAKRRLAKELKVVNEMGFNAYFLMAHDIVRYAGSRGFYHVGRGSGANSITSYCLKITDVDPIELDLYFERFMNSYRASPPDFDIDFSHRDRDEVIDYVFKRYGKDHVVLLGMHTTFKYRAAVRELAKVFGLPKDEIDRLATGQIDKEDDIHRKILFYARLMQGFPYHHSIHPGGMLITEKPVYYYTSVTIPPKGFATAHIDMFVAESIGLYKLDILSQRGLGHIKEALELIKEHKGIDIDIHNVSALKKDPLIAAQIRRADTIGCFYIESSSMRQVLKKLECDTYTTLVAASSIIRPGVGESGMMGEYIYRFRNPGKFTYLHPVLEEQLSETYGVMIYQEDVIKVAHHYAGLDLAEADVLRRTMSGKYRGTKELERIMAIFFAKSLEKGRPVDITTELWRQIASFAGYSFSKAHSASYAVESYQSLCLKTYHPVEFMVAVINNWGGFYSRQTYFHELKRTGIAVEPPCVNSSVIATNIVSNRVYMGLEYVHNLEKSVMEIIMEQRLLHGPYQHLQDFIERTGCPLEQLNTLIKVGALRFTGLSYKKLLWEANFLRSHTSQPVAATESLFQEAPMVFDLPELPSYPLERFYKEIEFLGFPLGDIFELVADDPSRYLLASQLPAYKGHQVTALGYLVTHKGTVTKKGSRQYMFFGTFLDAAGDWLDTVHFPAAAARYPLQGEGFYRLRGKVIEEFGVHSIAVEQMEKVGIKPFK